MKTMRNILIIIGVILLSVGLLGWLGLQIQPQSFPAYLANVPPYPAFTSPSEKKIT
jgi:hypothetical protein